MAVVADSLQCLFLLSFTSYFSLRWGKEFVLYCNVYEAQRGTPDFKWWRWSNGGKIKPPKIPRASYKTKKNPWTKNYPPSPAPPQKKNPKENLRALRISRNDCTLFALPQRALPRIFRIFWLPPPPGVRGTFLTLAQSSVVPFRFLGRPLPRSYYFSWKLRGSRVNTTRQGKKTKASCI